MQSGQGELQTETIARTSRPVTDKGSSRTGPLVRTATVVAPSLCASLPHHTRSWSPATLEMLLGQQGRALQMGRHRA